MNEIQRIRNIEREADRIYDAWRKYLEKNMDDPRYWDWVHDQAVRFGHDNDDCLTKHYAGTVIASRVIALEDEWRRIKK